MSENEFRAYLRRIAESNRARFGAARLNGEERVAENGQLMRSAELTFDEARYVVALLNDLRKRKLDVILVWSLDRLARSLAVDELASGSRELRK